jgi:hypothetical protein
VFLRNNVVQVEEHSVATQTAAIWTSISYVQYRNALLLRFPIFSLVMNVDAMRQMNIYAKELMNEIFLLLENAILRKFPDISWREFTK